MSDNTVRNKFYFNMGLLMLVLVVAGFASAAFVRGTSPFELPLLFHLHGMAFIAWFLLYINQARLIGHNAYDLHRTLGYSSLVVAVMMMVTGVLIAAASYQRGISPVPDTTLQQFMAFPLVDLSGFLVFYTLGVLKRSNGPFHKHCMLMAGIAILDPALARLAISIGFIPLALVMHVGLVVAVMVHDRKTAGGIHAITWAGLAFVILRLVFIFTIAAGGAWASLVNRMFG